MDDHSSLLGILVSDMAFLGCPFPDHSLLLWENHQTHPQSSHTALVNLDLRCLQVRCPSWTCVVSSVTCLSQADPSTFLANRTVALFGGQSPSGMNWSQSKPIINTIVLMSPILHYTLTHALCHTNLQCPPSAGGT